MPFAPILDAPLAVQVHVATVLPAALIGACLLANPKGTPLHRRLGRIWFALMVATALSSFFIQGINVLWGFSPIHLLSAFVLSAAWQAYQAARRGDIKAHRAGVVAMYAGGIGGAGLFTLLPNRIMGQLLFGGGVETIAVVTFIALTGLLLVPAVKRWRRHRML
jgi:uncharacterized membrane protein